MDAMIEFKEVLIKEIKTVDEDLLPLLKEYLNNVRDVRMSMTREVRDILQSTREMTEVTKLTKPILELATAVKVLQDTLTPETVELLRRIVR